MTHTLASIGVVLVLWSTSLYAQDGPRRGTIKDVSKDSVVITADGKVVTCSITADTRWMSAANQQITTPSEDNGVKAGAAVIFLARERNGRQVLIGLKLIGENRRDGRKPTPLNEPGEIRRGKIAKLDVEKRAITLSVGGKDDSFELTDDAIVLGASGKDLKSRFAGIKEGADVQFKVAKRDDRSVVVAVKPAGSNPARPVLPKVETDKLVPLTALGQDQYQGFEGGLYPDGKNERPTEHEAAGLTLAKQIRPLDREGNASPDGWKTKAALSEIAVVRSTYFMPPFGEAN